MPKRAPLAPPEGTLAFRWSAAGALSLHAIVLFSGPLSGGADLTPHLRLMQQMADAPALRNVYAPAFHAAGALLDAIFTTDPAAGIHHVRDLGGATLGALVWGLRLAPRDRAVEERRVKTTTSRW